MLHVAVGDPPWNTGMAWVDAMDAFPTRDPAEVDRIVAESLLELLDQGYIWFFKATGFDDEFRARSEDEALPRDEVAVVLTAGRLPPDPNLPATTTAVTLSGSGGGTPQSRRAGPERQVRLNEVLSFRATSTGEERHSQLVEDDYRIFGRGEH